MSTYLDAAERARLARLDAVKRRDHVVGESLGLAVAELFKKQVARRHTKLGTCSEAWCDLVPEALQERSCVESLHRGRLTVWVDSAPHLYQLRQLLLSGLEKELVTTCRGSGLRSVSLKRGRWYDERGEPRF
jgi:hypothetical protein